MNRPVTATLVVLALGALVLGTSELVIVGLIPVISQDLRLPAGLVGSLASVYAVGVALAGPPLAIMLQRLPARRVVTVALAAMALGNAGTAAGQSFGELLAARALTGAAAAAYVAAALSVATTLVGPQRRGQAIAIVFGGVTLSTVVGVPLGTLAGGTLGWRPVFAVLALVTAGLAVAAPLIMQDAPAEPRSAAARLRVLARRGLPGLFAVSALVTAGQYAAFTYLVVLLAREAGLGPSAASAVLLGTGLSATLGNFAGGRAASRSAHRTMTWSAVVAAACLCVIPAVMADLVLLLPVALLWSAVFAAFSTAAQTGVSHRAGPDGRVAAAVNISAFNIGIAAGSAAGGRLLEQAGFRVLYPGAAAVMAVGVIIALGTRHTGHLSEGASESTRPA
jgi:MFS transporter, DHA1 family, inner membrane transport protein